MLKALGIFSFSLIPASSTDNYYRPNRFDRFNTFNRFNRFNWFNNTIATIVVSEEVGELQSQGLNDLV
jgi:hypothetical protein